MDGKVERIWEERRDWDCNWDVNEERKKEMEIERTMRRKRN